MLGHVCEKSSTGGELLSYAKRVVRDNDGALTGGAAASRKNRLNPNKIAKTLWGVLRSGPWSVPLFCLHKQRACGFSITGLKWTKCALQETPVWRHRQGGGYALRRYCVRGPRSVSRQDRQSDRLAQLLEALVQAATANA